MPVMDEWICHAKKNSGQHTTHSGQNNGNRIPNGGCQKYPTNTLTKQDKEILKHLRFCEEENETFSHLLNEQQASCGTRSL